MKHPLPLFAAVAVLVLALGASASSSRAAAPAPGDIVFDRELQLFRGNSGLGVQSLAIADFDGDGRVDVAATAATSSCSLTVFLGDDTHEFRGVRTSPAGDCTGALAAGDFDEDGHPDLVLGTSYLRGLGDGRFSAPLTLVPESMLMYSEPLAADFDGDGHLDVALTLSVTGGQALVVLWGHGDGTFGPRTTVAALASAFECHLAADVTGDGRPDLIGGLYHYSSSTPVPDTVVVCVNGGGRAFGAPLRSATDGGVFALAVADVDLDGDVDLVAYDRILSGHGDGTFTQASAALPLPVPSSRYGAVAMADLDQDGTLDLIARGARSLGVYRVHPDWTIERSAEYSTPGGGYARVGASIADLDADGRLDVVTCPHDALDTTHSAQRGAAVLFAGPGGGLRGIRYDGAVRGALYPIRLRADGLADLMSQTTASDLHLSRNRGAGDFDAPVAVGPGTLVAVHDLDLDGFDDVVAQVGPAIHVQRGDGAGGLTPSIAVATGTVRAIGEVDGVPGLDLVTVDGIGMASLLPGLGDGGFDAPVSLGVNVSGAVLTVGDLDGDGRGDLVAAKALGTTGDSVCVYRSMGRAPMSALQTGVVFFATGACRANMGQLGLADLDRDGDLDLVMLHLGGSIDPNHLHSLTNDGTGHLTAGQDYSIGTDAYAGMVIGDLDGDGVPDIVAAQNWGGVEGFLHVFKGLGDGTFARSALMPETRAGFGRLALGRFDADARPDLVIGLREVPGILELRNLSLPGEVTAATAALASASIVDGVAHVVWATSAAPGEVVVVQRAVDGGAWSAVARVLPDGDGRVRYDDTGAVSGHRYGYRVAFDDGGLLVPAAEVWLEAPALATLALAGAVPNPVAGDLTVAFTLASRGPAALTLFDLAGRRVAARDLSTFEPGAHRVALAPGAALAPGLYLIRLTTPHRTLVSRAIVVR